MVLQVLVGCRYLDNVTFKLETKVSLIVCSYNLRHSYHIIHYVIPSHNVVAKSLHSVNDSFNVLCEGVQNHAHLLTDMTGGYMVGVVTE